MTTSQRDPQTDPDNLTIRGVAARLGVSVRTVHRWVAAGRLPVHVKGPGPTGMLFFRRADVEAIAESDGLR
jgi:excisionase family DNA binding protein